MDCKLENCLNCNIFNTKLVALIKANTQNAVDKGDFLGEYSNMVALQQAYPSVDYGRYATILGKKYYFNRGFEPPKWFAVEITTSAYQALTDKQKTGQPEFLIVPG